MCSAQLVEPGLVALHASRGYQTVSSKLFMRASVLLCDALLFLPAVYHFFSSWPGARKSHQRVSSALVTLAANRALVARWQMIAVFLVLLQPAFILIDHGHFQCASSICFWRIHTVLQVQLFLLGAGGLVAGCAALGSRIDRECAVLLGSGVQADGAVLLACFLLLPARPILAADALAIVRFRFHCWRR